MKLIINIIDSIVNLLPNENPIARAIRQALIVAISALLEQAISGLSAVDVSNDRTELLIIGAIIAVLTGLDKAWREWRAAQTG